LIQPGIIFYNDILYQDADQNYFPATDSLNKNFQDQSLALAKDSVQNITSADSIINQLRTGFIFSDADSLLTVDDYIRSTNHTPVFTRHELQPYITNPSPIKKFTPDWLTIVLFITIAFFTWLKVVNNKIINQLFTAFFNSSVTNQIVRDENILVQRASVLLSVVFYFSGALFLYQVSVYYGWEYKIINTGFARFVILVLFIATAYSFKMVLLKLLGFVFEIDRTVSSYIFNIFLINNIIGIVFIPVVILIAYVSGFTNYLIYTGTALVILGFIFCLFRGFIIWTSLPRFSLYYLILYLCAIEVAPLLIIFKLT
jgi:hypothetical protein